MHFDPFWNALAEIQNELISRWQKNENRQKKCDKMVQLTFPLSSMPFISKNDC